MYPAEIKRISIDDLGHNTYLERLINLAGEEWSCIVKDGIEVASMPSERETDLLIWWNTEGWRMWKDRRKKVET